METNISDEKINFISIVLKNGDLFSIWEGNEHIVIACSGKHDLLITPMQSNSIKIESKNKEQIIRNV